MSPAGRNAGHQSPAPPTDRAANRPLAQTVPPIIDTPAQLLHARDTAMPAHTLLQDPPHRTVDGAQIQTRQDPGRHSPYQDREPCTADRHPNNVRRRPQRGSANPIQYSLNFTQRPVSIWKRLLACVLQFLTLLVASLREAY